MFQSLTAVYEGEELLVRGSFVSQLLPCFQQYNTTASLLRLSMTEERRPVREGGC